MKYVLALFILIGLAGLACNRSTPATEPVTTEAAPVQVTATTTVAISPSVPEEYQALYNELDADLSAFLATLPEDRGQPPIFAAELLYANGNVGPALLQPGVLEAVCAMLDSFQTIGVQGVGVQISYPLLQPDFPRFEEYLDFYWQVADEVRRRGMTLLVETGPVFPDPEASGEFEKQVDYSSLTNESYFRTKREMLVTIAREIQPDNLALGNEPGREEMLTGLRFSPQEYFAFVDAALAEIDPSWGVKVGAGSGT